MPIYWTGACARPCADAAFKSRCSGNVAGASSRTLPLRGLDERGPANASERRQQRGHLCSFFHPRSPPVSSMLCLGKMRAWRSRRSRRLELKAVFSPFGAGRTSTYFQQAKPPNLEPRISRRCSLVWPFALQSPRSLTSSMCPLGLNRANWNSQVFLTERHGCKRLRKGRSLFEFALLRGHRLRGSRAAALGGARSLQQPVGLLVGLLARLGTKCTCGTLPRARMRDLRLVSSPPAAACQGL